MAICDEDKYIQDITWLNCAAKTARICDIYTNKTPTTTGRYFLVGVAGFEPAQA